MARARNRRESLLAVDAIEVEGALISPAMLTRIAKHEAENQSPADYGIPKGLTLRDEIARYFRIGQAIYADLAASKSPSRSATIAFVEALLRSVFGFADVQHAGDREIDGRDFAITLEALGGRVPVVIVAPTDPVDKPSDCLADGRSAILSRRSRSPFVRDVFLPQLWSGTSPGCGHVRGWRAARFATGHR